MDDLFKLYNYIKYCLYSVHTPQWLAQSEFVSVADLHHDIFVYLVGEKGITTFNSGSRRYVYLLAKYRPITLRKYKYKQLPIIGDTEKLNVCFFDTPFELNTNEGGCVIRKNNNTTYTVEYIDGNVEKYNHYTELANCLKANPSTVYRWAHYGTLPKQRPKWAHIKKVSVNYVTGINGYNVKVTKKMNKNQWDKIDKSKYILDEYNEHLQFYKHTETGEVIKVVLKQGD